MEKIEDSLPTFVKTVLANLSHHSTHTRKSKLLNNVLEPHKAPESCKGRGGAIFSFIY